MKVNEETSLKEKWKLQPRIKYKKGKKEFQNKRFVQKKSEHINVITIKQMLVKRKIWERSTAKKNSTTERHHNLELDKKRLEVLKKIYPVLGPKKERQKHWWT